MDDHNNKPEITLRDGNLKATVWRNEGDKGEYHAVNLAKTYTGEDGKPRDTASFSQSDLLRIAELSRETYGAINDIKRERPLLRTDVFAHSGEREAFRSRRAGRKTPEPDQERGRADDR